VTLIYLLVDRSVQMVFVLLWRKLLQKANDSDVKGAASVKGDPPAGLPPVRLRGTRPMPRRREAPRRWSEAAGGPRGRCAVQETRRRLWERCVSCAAVPGPSPLRDAVAATAERPAGPALRPAVGGRGKAGRSTLVNALLGSPSRAHRRERVHQGFRLVRVPAPR